MRIVLAGGTGLLGRILAHDFRQQGHQIVVLSRHGSADGRVVEWDGRTLGPWAREIDGADAVVNLAGRSVNCRYNASNLKEMMDSRAFSPICWIIPISRSCSIPITGTSKIFCLIAN